MQTPPHEPEEAQEGGPLTSTKKQTKAKLRKRQRGAASTRSAQKHSGASSSADALPAAQRHFRSSAPSARRRRNTKEARKKKPKPWLAAVQQCVLFDGLSPAEVRFVMKTARPIDTLEGMVIYEHDTAPSRLFLIHSGTYRASILAGDGFRLARDYVSTQGLKPK